MGGFCNDENYSSSYEESRYSEDPFCVLRRDRATVKVVGDSVRIGDEYFPIEKLGPTATDPKIQFRPKWTQDEFNKWFTEDYVPWWRAMAACKGEVITDEQIKAEYENQRSWRTA